MRLLVFGKTGQVARSLAKLCAAEGIEAQFLARDEADLTNPLACAARIAETDADVVMNAAAYTAVDKAEEDRQSARLVNGGSPMAMAREAARRDLPFLHISTDYVFDGRGERPWLEDDKPNPQGAYGRTKLAGEVGVLGAGGPHAVLRTAWVFSPYGANFVKTMLRLGAMRDELNVVQFGGPTPAAGIAAALLVMARAFHDGRAESGVFHYAGAPKCAWADFAEAIFAGAGMATKVNRIPSSEYPTPAKRPANSVLDCGKINAVYGIEQPDWQAGLKDVLKVLEAGK
ncbi:MAG: dTDP-4-dehydrorhamnose reductase [Alphaproteobacteria bacterium]|nr:dTDP-4-dehydrorhamnose reductase [Alphaproteobacteria bacterium]